MRLTFKNRRLYYEQAVKFRLHEFDLQIAAIREGMAGIIPVPLLSLITSEHMEQLVCGMPFISIHALKKIVRYVRFIFILFFSHFNYYFIDIGS